MKITDWKLTRVLLHLPKEDCDSVKKDLKDNGKLSPENQSKVAKMHNAVGQSVKVKGAFGKKGTNRKLQIWYKQQIMRELFEKAKQKVEDEEREQLPKDSQNEGK